MSPNVPYMSLHIPWCPLHALNLNFWVTFILLTRAASRGAFAPKKVNLPHETAHTSLEPTIQILKVNSSYTHSWCTHCAWISFTVVQLNFIPASVHSETVYTTVHSLVPVCPLFCQPITEDHLFTCFALIGPLVIIPWTWTWTWSLMTACWPRPFRTETDVVKMSGFLNNTLYV